MSWKQAHRRRLRFPRALNKRLDIHRLEVLFDEKARALVPFGLTMPCEVTDIVVVIRPLTQKSPTAPTQP